MSDVRLISVMKTSIAISLLILFLTAGLAAAKPKSAAAWTEQDKQDLLYIRELHLRDRVYSRPLDLSDAIQYRFFMRQLELSGVTPKESPQLFRSIAEARQARVAGQTTCPAATCASGQVCPVNTITQLAPTGSGNFTTTAYSTIPGNPSVATNVIGLYDHKGKVFATPTSVSQNATGYDVVNTNSGTAPADAKTIQAIGTYYYVTASNGCPYSGSLYAETDPISITINNISPADVNDNGEILVCLNRKTSDCDYFASGQLVSMPVQGNAVYSKSIAANSDGTPANAFGSVSITAPESGNGGGCSLPANQSLPGNSQVTATPDGTGSTVAWNISGATFGTGLPCFPNSSDVVYNLNLTVFSAAKGHPHMISVTSADSCPANNTVCIPAMSVAWGCMAEGTKITLADGGEKPIESVEAGTKVRSDPKGGILTVSSYTKGNEEKPMVRIATVNGRELLLTETHPVLTHKGVKAARDLQVGDVVTTDKGNSKLVSVTREMYGGNVWNLNVGLEKEDRVRLTETNTTFFANGILVGDGRMQGRLERAHHESPDEVLKRLDPKWHEDYRNSLRRGKPAKGNAR